MLALFEREELNARIKENHFIRNLFPWMGMILILIGLLCIRKDSSFPGKTALLPTLGTLLILVGPSHWINKNILSNRFLVWFGLISYPLYVWHWILLSAGKLAINPSLGVSETIFLVSLSIIFAWLTYKFIELPVRTIGLKRISLILLGLMVLVGVFGHIITRNDGFKNRYQTSKNERIERVVSVEKVRPNITNCSEIYSSLSGYSKGYSTCLKTSKNPNFLILGDSHANHLFLVLLIAMTLIIEM